MLVAQREGLNHFKACVMVDTEGPVISPAPL